MSQASELLNKLPEGQKYEMNDDYEAHIVIEADRHIKVPEALRKIAVQFDHNVETVTFDCPRYWDNLDMSEMTVYINYIRPDRVRGMYLAKDVKIDDEDQSMMHFTWTLSRTATLEKGKLRFLVCIKKLDADGNEENHWNSKLNDEMEVQEGLECEDAVNAMHSDIITDLLLRMDKILVATTPILDTTLTERGLAADAKSTGDRIKELTSQKTNQADFITEVSNRLNADKLLESRINSLVKVSDDDTEGNTELLDIRIDIDGVEHSTAGDAIRGQINDLKSKLAEQKVRFDCEESTVDEQTGDELFFDRVGEVMIFSSDSEADVWSCNGNYFPTIEKHFDVFTNFAQIDISGDSIVATTLAGKTYQNIRTKPIFLKAGTYVFHREYEILSGNANPYEVNSIGFCYISTCTREGENLEVNKYSIQGINKDAIITFAEDTYVKLNIYSNLNANLDYDLTIRFYNLSITRNSYDSYIVYRGENIYAMEGVMDGFDGVSIYSDNPITVSYVKLLGMSYEDYRELVRDQLIDTSNTVVCWGDSLTNGTGSSVLKPDGMTLDSSYPAVLSRLITDGKTVINGGVGGEPSWMVAARQGGMAIMVEPLTIPADATPVRVYFKGQEQDYFYDNTLGKWSYLENNLSYNIAVDSNSLVNPCYIAGIEGMLTRELVQSGEPDPDTGETVQSNTYAYYFTRTTTGEEYETVTPKQLVTHAYSALRNAINVIWVGQNDAPAHVTDSGTQYILQGVDRNRVGCMVNILDHNKYIVMDLPSGDNQTRASDVQAFNQQFGAHYLNIREYIAKYGIAIANGLGANIIVSEDDQVMIDAGKIPECLRIDGVHGNYWYYQIVAIAVYQKGVDLGYWG